MVGAEQVEVVLHRVLVLPVQLEAGPRRVDRIGAALHEEHGRRPVGEVAARHRRPFRAGQHGDRPDPVVGAAAVGGEGSDRIAAIGLPGGGDLAAVQQAGERVTGLRAAGQQPAQHIGHVRRLVHQVRFVGPGARLAAGLREIQHGDHVAGAGPGLQQVRVRATALHEPGTEQDQREPAAGPPRAGCPPGHRVPDPGDQRARAQVRPGRAEVPRLDEGHLPLRHPEAAGGTDRRGRGGPGRRHRAGRGLPPRRPGRLRRRAGAGGHRHGGHQGNRDRPGASEPGVPCSRNHAPDSNRPVTPEPG